MKSRRKTGGRIHVPGGHTTGGSKREAELVRLLDQRPPSGGGRPDDTGAEEKENAVLV